MHQSSHCTWRRSAVNCFCAKPWSERGLCVLCLFLFSLLNVNRLAVGPYFTFSIELLVWSFKNYHHNMHLCSGISEAHTHTCRHTHTDIHAGTHTHTHTFSSKKKYFNNILGHMLLEHEHVQIFCTFLQHVQVSDPKFCKAEKGVPTQKTHIWPGKNHTTFKIFFFNVFWINVHPFTVCC